MLDFSVTFLITIVNIAFLYVVLRKILFKPVSKFMEDRTSKIQRDIDLAKLATARAESLEAEYAEKVKNAQSEGNKVVQAARERAEREYAEIVASAREEAAKIVSASRLELSQEFRRAEEDLRARAAELSISAASRVVEENLDSGKNRELVEKFLASVGEM